jgi:hypothetical protein
MLKFIVKVVEFVLVMWVVGASLLCVSILCGDRTYVAVANKLLDYATDSREDKNKFREKEGLEKIK